MYNTRVQFITWGLGKEKTLSCGNKCGASICKYSTAKPPQMNHHWNWLNVIKMGGSHCYDMLSVMFGLADIINVTMVNLEVGGHVIMTVP